MTSLEIINRALYRLGSQPAVTASDTSPKAAYRACIAYPLARDEVLRLVPWPCAIQRTLMKNMNNQADPWTASTWYGVGQRVTNDTLKTYISTVEGRSAAATGPTGSGTAITDGTCEWDYVELSTATTNWCHAINTAYAVGDLVTWDTGKVYACITAGTSGAASQPTGTSADITDGTAHWRYAGTPPINRTVYAYQYVVPADCLRLLKIPNAAEAKESDQGAQYLREGISIYCDQDDSFAKYVKQETDPSNWDTLLQEAVVLKIASDIAFDVAGDQEKANQLYKDFAGMYATARVIAMNEGSEGTPEQLRWEDA